MRRLACLALLALACGRRDAKPAASPAGPPPALIELTRLEARREAGLPDLDRFQKDRDPVVRVHVALALGRIGGPEATKRLLSLGTDSVADVRIEAARALGIAGAENVAAELVPRLDDTPGGTPTILEALGRLGDDKTIPRIVAALADTAAPNREAAALALARYGRRKLPIGNEARHALVARAGDPDASIRYAVAYALARELTPPPEASAEEALAKLATDAGSETRAVAIYGLAARAAPRVDLLRHALDDDDWRVRVQAARALGGDRSTPDSRAVLARWLDEEWTAIADLETRLRSPRVHAVHEGLTKLVPHGKEKEVRRVADRLYEATHVAESTEAKRYTPEILRAVDPVNCLAAAIRARAGGPVADLATCGHGTEGLPVAERRKLYADALDSRKAPAKDQLALADELWRSADRRLRVLAVEVASRLDAPRARQILQEAFSAPETEIATFVPEALALAERVDPGLVDAILAWKERAAADRDIRLSRLHGLEALGKLPAFPATSREPAAAACEASRHDPNRTVREAARACVKTLRGADPGEALPEGEPTLPPLDPTPVVGRSITWKVTTTKGTFLVELHGGVAPWAVTELTTLAAKGFYDGLFWHRVVPDFVVQGGDPTGTGGGDAGFVLPAEPSALRYVRGTVGIADGGFDTGGCQWFVTHTRTPHLDGRYTIVGKVTSGMEVVDSLLVGDRILSVKEEG